MTDDKKQLSSEQKSNLQVLLFLQPSLVKVLLWQTISRWGQRGQLKIQTQVSRTGQAGWCWVMLRDICFGS